MALILSFGVSPAFAAVCPDKSMTLDEIVDAINATSGCERAMTVRTTVNLAAAEMSGLAPPWKRKCEGDFRASLKPPQKAM